MLAVCLVGLVVFLVTGSVNLQMPLYGEYAKASGVGETVKATMFATYVAGLLPTLLLLGGVSDKLGRKPALLAGLVLSSTATLLVLRSPGIASLFQARALQGIAVGITVGSATAYVAELLPHQSRKSSHAIAITTSLGFGGGALATSLVLAWQHTPTPISYHAMLGLAVITAIGVILFCPSIPRQGGHLIRLPIVRRESLRAGLSIAMAWSVSGLVVAMVPSHLSEVGLAGWAGAVLFGVNGAGVVAQKWVRTLDENQALKIGYLVVPLGFWLILLGTQHDLLPLVLLGSCVAGSGCYGFIYLAGLSLTIRWSPREQSRASAGYFLFAYLGFSLPSIAVGALADVFGVHNALYAFGTMLAVTCAVGWLMFPRPAPVSAEN